MNKVILAGNLGADAELKTFDNGNSVLNFRLATTEKWKDRDGNKKEKTNWHSCQLNGKRGESLAQYLTKGTKVIVTGSVQYREYEKEGVKRYATDIRVDDLEFTGGGKRQEDGEGGGYERRARQAPDQDPNNGAETNDFGSDFGTDEVPF